MHYHKKIYLLLTHFAASSLFATVCLSQSANQNYVRTRVTRSYVKTAAVLDQYTALKDSVMTTIQYIDGLGRPLQTVQQQASPGAKDVVQPVIYDEFGREAIKYLPYALTTGASDGSYKADALTPVTGGLARFYNPSGSTGSQQANGMVRTLSPQAVTAFEPSPLNRVTQQGAPGDAWQLGVTPDAHTGKVVYTSNDQSGFNTNLLANNPGSHKVALYKAAINADGSRTLGRDNNWLACYLSNELYLTISKNENWVSDDGCMNTTEEYKDKEGHVLLKRTYNATKDASGNPIAEIVSTYYVYDDLGNLCFVLTPGANPDNTTAISQSYMDGRCYQYRYDERNRLTQKKLPGKGWEFMVYNTLDQVVMTQDGNQRNKAPQEWTMSKYDAQGRNIITAIWRYTGSPIDSSAGAPNLQYLTALAAFYKTTGNAKWETRDAAIATGYTSASEPPTTLGAINSYLNINYYDDYTGIPAAYDQQANYSSMTTGLLTSSKTWVLNSTDALWTVNYYDNEGRVARTLGQHYLGGSPALSIYNYDEVTTIYNFNDQPRTVTRKHFVKNTGNTDKIQALLVNDYYTYDHMGRGRKVSQQIKSGTLAAQSTPLLSLSDYNEIGQLKKKSLHSIDNAAHFLQTIDYRYNPRGWLSSINNASLTADGIINTGANDLFGMELSYESPAAGTKAQYNGNIASLTWKQAPAGSTTPLQTSYDFGYDYLNRLMDAASGEGGTKNGYYDEHLTYFDKVGDIATISRYDKVMVGSTATRKQIDNLTYTYNGYQHTRVDDLAADAMGFNDLVQVANEYTYDLNGNQRKDQNRNLSSIAYNVLNLPQTITKGDGSTVVYVYDATGRKLRKVATAGGVSNVTEYINGIQYEGNNAATTIAFFQTADGRVRNNGAGVYNYEYDLKDHLGNTRVTLRPLSSDPLQQTAEVLQENSYYPFGATIASMQPIVASPKNNYLYNGKELQDETGLYDYGARFYDPVIARFTTIDPLAEKMRRYSPYNYGLDNPIRFIDPDGRGPEDTNDGPPGKRVTVTVTAVSAIKLNNDLKNASGVPAALLRSATGEKLVSTTTFGATVGDGKVTDASVSRDHTVLPTEPGGHTIPLGLGAGLDPSSNNQGGAIQGQNGVVGSISKYQAQIGVAGQMVGKTFGADPVTITQSVGIAVDPSGNVKISTNASSFPTTTYNISINTVNEDGSSSTKTFTTTFSQSPVSQAVKSSTFSTAQKPQVVNYNINQQ